MGKFWFGPSRNHTFLLMFNEGGRYFNFTVLKYRKGEWFVYLYIGGKRWSKWF